MTVHSAIPADTFLRHLALAVARNDVSVKEPIDLVVRREGITPQEYVAIETNPVYTRYLESYKKELTESGFSFSAKARVLAEELLPEVYHIAKDVNLPAAARVKAIENLVDWGNLKPKPTDLQSGGGGFSISISIGDNVITATTNGLKKAQEIDGDDPIIDIEPEFSSPPAAATPKIDLNTTFAEEIPLNRVPTTFEEPTDYEYAGDDVL